MWKRKLDDIILPHICNGRQIDVPIMFDFILASNSLHETPDPASLLEDLFTRLKPGGRFLLMEPASHLKPVA